MRESFIEALKDFKYQANLCAAIINHANSVGKKLEDDIKKMIQTIALYVLIYYFFPSETP